MAILRIPKFPANSRKLPFPGKASRDRILLLPAGQLGLGLIRPVRKRRASASDDPEQTIWITASVDVADGGCCCIAISDCVSCFFLPERRAPSHEESPHWGRSSVLAGRSFRKRPRQSDRPRDFQETPSFALSVRPASRLGWSQLAVHRPVETFKKP